MVSKSFYVRNGLIVGAASVDATTGNITTTGTLSASTATFTGVVTAPTPATADNSTKLATTAFVQTAVSAAGGVSVTSSATAPASPKAGAEWYDTTTGTLYQYISDGTASYWIDITGPTATTQSLSSTVIAGGSIDGTVIGGTAPAAASFTNLAYTGSMTGSTGVVNIGAGQLYKDASGNFGIGTNTPAAKLHVIGDGMRVGVAGDLGNFLLSSSKAGGAIQFRQSGATTDRYLAFGNNDNNQLFREAARIDDSGNFTVGTTGGNAAQGNIDIATASVALTTTALHLGYSGVSNYGSRIVNVNTPSSTAAGLFKIQQGTITGWRDDLIIDNNGNLLLGQSSTNLQNLNSFWQSAGQAYTSHASSATNGTGYAIFGYNGVAIGSILQSGTTGVSYNTTSDYRLKDNQQPLTGSGAFIDALKPTTWEWSRDGRKDAGFIAHEFQEVCPNAVNGVKDETEEQEYEVAPADGDTAAVMGTRIIPKYQSMQASSAEVIANLVAELQLLRKRIAALENK